MNMKVKDVKDNETAWQLLINWLAHLPYPAFIAETASLPATDPLIVFANAAAAGYAGRPAAELIGKSFLTGATVVPETLNKLRATLSHGQPTYEQLIEYTRDGKDSWLSVDIVPLGGRNGKANRYLALGRDVTKQKLDADVRQRLQEWLFQSQKMEGIGVLAGGVAHDLNNILTGILGSAELVKMHLAPGHPAYADLNTIVQATQRAAGLAKELLAYAANEKDAKEILDLNEIVTAMLIILRSQMPKSIVVRKALTPEVPDIEANVVQLQQVIMNLCLNAGDAMSEQGGILSITTDRVEVDEEQCRSLTHGPSKPGSYAVFEVSDTGRGMDPQMLKYIFEPFYSSKAAGRGLGLAAALSIIKRHGGGIEVTSEIGEGSTFRVFLPASAKSRQHSMPAQPELAHGGQTILFVDDEEMLRSLCQRMLEHLGYRVILAADGIEAVRVYRERARDIDLVILDLSMPRQSGEDAYQEMRNIRRDMKVLLCCGYDEALANRKIAAENLVGFLPKPFGIDVLAQAVQAALRHTT